MMNSLSSSAIHHSTMIYNRLDQQPCTLGTTQTKHHIYPPNQSFPENASTNRESKSVNESKQNCGSNSITETKREIASELQIKKERDSYPFNIDSAERVLIQKLRARDREVKQHEQAHIAVGGRYVKGGPSYTYQRGPDGHYYAIGGEVSLDVSPVPGDPEDTIDKAQTIQRAATAPINPSTQDRMVAARARAMEQQAKIEKRNEQSDEQGLNKINRDHKNSNISEGKSILNLPPLDEILNT